MLRMERERERKHAFSVQCPRGAVQPRTHSAHPAKAQSDESDGMFPRTRVTPMPCSHTYEGETLWWPLAKSLRVPA